MSYFPKTKRYINLFLPFLLGVILYFGLDVEVVHAAEESSGFWSSAGNAVGGALLLVLNGILYGVFVVVSYPVTWAAILLGWAVDPAAVHTLFTMNSIYLLWQMIRDFFNLFFILTLLFIAFATIFQIDSFNYKKTLGKLLLMALLVNFSFPIARFIIDATNVPMYFFMESMFTDKSQANGKGIVEVSFGSSGMQEIILPGSNGPDFVKGDSDLTVKIFTGIIFMFLFGVSLLVFAIMMVIRSIMLVVLIIFSPVGFAGMVIPGFRQYATKWWDNLLKYAMFGPASMLMMLVAVKFMQEFKVGGKQAMIAQASGATVDADAATYIATMASIVVPIVLIWTAITIGQTMGIAGAGMVTSRAQQFSKWAGRKASGADAVGKRWKAYSSEREKRANAKFAATNIGTRLATKANSKLDQISAKRIGGRFETETARLARSQEAERQKARVAEVKKTHMLDQTSDKDLLEMKRQAAEGKAKTKDQKALHVAATQEIAKRKLDENSGEPGHGYTQDEAKKDMQTTRENFAEMPGGVSNAVQTETQKQVAQTYGEAAYAHDASGQLSAAGEQQMREAIRKGEIDAAKISGAGITQNFMRLMAAEGKLNQQVVKTLKENNPTMDIDKHLDGALNKMGDDMATPGGAYDTASAEEKKRMEKAYTEMQKNYVYATGKFHSSATETDRDNVMKKADHETLMKMADTNKTEFNSEAGRLAQMGGPGKTAAILAKMSEEGKDVQGAVDTLNSLANTIGPVQPGSQQAAAQKAVKRMEGDYRFDGIV